MAKTPFDDYRDELEQQRAAWQRKPSLRAVYNAWYTDIVAALSPFEPTVELGSGCGNFKQAYPDVVATDVIAAGEFIDRIVDARDLPFEPGELGNIVMIDVLHHLPRPLRFLRSATQALQPGGRIVILEPAATPWGRLVLRTCHHEPVDMTQDVFAEDGTPEPPNEGLTFANQAFGTLLFVDHLEDTLAHLPELSVVRIEHSDFFVYPATGGFSYLNLMPARMVGPLRRLEARLNEPVRRRTGMRLLIVLERRPGH